MKILKKLNPIIISGKEVYPLTQEAYDWIKSRMKNTNLPN